MIKLWNIEDILSKFKMAAIMEIYDCSPLSHEKYSFTTILDKLDMIYQHFENKLIDLEELEAKTNIPGFFRKSHLQKNGKYFGSEILGEYKGVHK